MLDMRKKVLMDTLKSHFSTSCPASSVYVMALMGRGGYRRKAAMYDQVTLRTYPCDSRGQPPNYRVVNARSRGYKLLLLSRPLPCFRISGTPLLSRRGGSDE